MLDVLKIIIGAHNWTPSQRKVHATRFCLQAYEYTAIPRKLQELRVKQKIILS